jgi:Flp pilus assembly pilin Flp
MHRFRRALRDERGQNIIEYGVLAAFLSIAALATIRTIGPLVAALWARVIAVLQ